jgi:hypothetical protein
MFKSLSKVLACVALSCCVPEPDGVLEPYSWAVPADTIDIPLNDICANASSFFVVGGPEGEGEVLQWSPSQWSRTEIPATERLQSCMGYNQHFIAVGDDGAILTKRVEIWRVETPPIEAAGANFSDVWANQDTQVVIGTHPDTMATLAMIHNDDEGWQMIDTSSLGNTKLSALWGSSTDDIWFVGSEGFIGRLEDGAITSIESPTDEPLVDIHGSSGSEIYALGGSSDETLLLEWDGTTFRERDTALPPFKSLWTAPNRHLYMGGQNRFGRYYRYHASRIQDDRVSIELPDISVLALVGFQSNAVVALAFIEETDQFAVLSHGANVGGGIVKPLGD